MKNWVILFVKNGSEEKQARMLKECLSADVYLPFLPTKEVSRKHKGVTRMVRQLLFPGYIFIQTEIDEELIAAQLRRDLSLAGWPRDIYSILHYGDDENRVALYEKERDYWERLFDDDFCIKGSRGIIEGDKIIVISGPLVGKEGLIKKISRHARKAIVELEMFGAMRKITLTLEIVKKRS